MWTSKVVGKSKDTDPFWFVVIPQKGILNTTIYGVNFLFYHPKYIINFV